MSIFSIIRPVIGVIHLPPLPGAPRSGVSMERLIRGAVRDARVLVKGGARGVIVENLGDAPFSKGSVEPHVVACMAVVAEAVKKEVGDSLFVGINVLRNDAKSALGIASAVGASFIRVNVHVGAMVTDQGLIEGDARETLLYRNRVCPNVGIAADILVKHASPLGAADLIQIGKDAHLRGGASSLIITGCATGAEASVSSCSANGKGLGRERGDT
jgi:membrane complex biogenesis BtpA family protein